MNRGNEYFVLFLVALLVLAVGCDSLKNAASKTFDLDIPIPAQSLNSSMLGNISSDKPIYLCLPTMDLTDILTAAGFPPASLDLMTAVEIKEIQYKVSGNQNGKEGVISLWNSPGAPGISQQEPATLMICETENIPPGTDVDWTDMILDDNGVQDLQNSIINYSNPFAVCIGWTGGANVNMTVEFDIKMEVTASVL